VLREQGGYFYGRGTTDDKAMAAIFVANLIRFKQENYRPERDLILALTSDEEGGNWNGVDFLVKNHRALIDAELGINEGGGGRSRTARGREHDPGEREGLRQLQARGHEPGRPQLAARGGERHLPARRGHRPRAKYKFPPHLNEVTRRVLHARRRDDQRRGRSRRDACRGGAADGRGCRGELSQRPFYNALPRTTCVATQLLGGHAENALPQMARATINCRVLPDESADAVQKTLVKVLADDKITVTPINPPKPSPPRRSRPP
jgi:acetylornithine deacetylase/succinyl-diaminopimelate desuccinylase-like protein